MSDRDLLYKILSYALLDIREAAFKNKSHKAIFIVSDLIHNLPSSLLNAEQNQKDFSLILSDLKERSRIKNCNGWLNQLINDISA